MCVRCCCAAAVAATEHITFVRKNSLTHVLLHFCRYNIYTIYFSYFFSTVALLKVIIRMFRVRTLGVIIMALFMPSYYTSLKMVFKQEKLFSLSLVLKLFVMLCFVFFLGTTKFFSFAAAAVL